MFQSKASKEIEKRQVTRRAITSMDRQINKLEEQKKIYIGAAKTAKRQGLNSQYSLAISGLRMTIAQQKRVYEMKLNFEITAQMKDMSMMTTEFLKGMGSLSHEMLKLTNQKEFSKVQKEFELAMTGVEIQTEQMEDFLDETQATFETNYSGTAEQKRELEALIDNEAASEEMTSDSIDRELLELKKKIYAES